LIRYFNIKNTDKQKMILYNENKLN